METCYIHQNTAVGQCGYVYNYRGHNIKCQLPSHDGVGRCRIHLRYANEDVLQCTERFVNNFSDMIKVDVPNFVSIMGNYFDEADKAFVELDRLQQTMEAAKKEYGEMTLLVDNLRGQLDRCGADSSAALQHCNNERDKLSNAISAASSIIATRTRQPAQMMMAPTIAAMPMQTAIEDADMKHDTTQDIIMALKQINGGNGDSDVIASTIVDNLQIRGASTIDMNKVNRNQLLLQGAQHEEKIQNSLYTYNNLQNVSFNFVQDDYIRNMMRDLLYNIAGMNADNTQAIRSTLSLVMYEDPRRSHTRDQPRRADSDTDVNALSLMAITYLYDTEITNNRSKGKIDLLPRIETIVFSVLRKFNDSVKISMKEKVQRRFYEDFENNPVDVRYDIIRALFAMVEQGDNITPEERVLRATSILTGVTIRRS